MKKTYPAYLKGISRRTVAYIFLTVIAASVLLYSCRKIDAVPNNTKPIIDPAAVITKNDLLNWYIQLPVSDENNLNPDEGLRRSTGKLPFVIDWSKAIHKVINGKHVVRTPVGKNACIVFEKQGKNGLLDSYIYKWTTNTTKGQGYTGHVVKFSFQDYTLVGQRFEKDKLRKLYTYKLSNDKLNAAEITKAQKLYGQISTTTKEGGRSVKSNNFLGTIWGAIKDAVIAIGCTVTNQEYIPSEGTPGDPLPYPRIDGKCGEQLLAIDLSVMIGPPPTGADLNGTIYGAGGFVAIGGSLSGVSSGGNDPGVTSGGGGSGSGGGSNQWGNFSDTFWSTFSQMTGSAYTINAPGYSVPTTPTAQVSQSQINTALVNLDILTQAEKDGIVYNSTNNWGSFIIMAAQVPLSHYDKMMIKKHLVLMSGNTQVEYAKVVNRHYYHSALGTQPPYLWWQDAAFTDGADDLDGQDTRYWLEILNLPAPGDSFTDSNGNTVSYSSMSNFLSGNPAAIEHLNQGEFDQVSWPYDVPAMPIQTALTVNHNHYVLKMQHPDWPEWKLWSTAVYQALSGKIHFALDVAGMVPGEGTVANFLNGAIYYVEGDHINAAISEASMVPFVSWVNKGGKWVRLVATKTSMPVIEAAIKHGRVAIVSGKNVRFIKVAVEAFDYASVKALQAVKPADLTLRNLSSSLIDQFGHRIKPMATSLKNQIDDIALNGDAAGTKTEALAHDFFEAEGYVKYNAQFGAGQGFDGVYIKGSLSNPTDIIINEAKQMSSYGNIQLNAANSSGLPAQMRDTWVDNVIGRMNQQGGSLSTLAQTLANNRGLVTKTVTAVDKARKEFVVLKLGAY